MACFMVMSYCTNKENYGYGISTERVDSTHSSLTKEAAQDAILESVGVGPALDVDSFRGLSVCEESGQAVMVVYNDESVPGSCGDEVFVVELI